MVWAHFKLPPAPAPPEWSRLPVVCACGRDTPVSLLQAGPTLLLPCLGQPNRWDRLSPQPPRPKWPRSVPVVGVLPLLPVHRGTSLLTADPEPGGQPWGQHCGLWQRRGGLREPSQRLWNVLSGSEPIASAQSSLARTSHLALLNQEGPRTWPEGRGLELGGERPRGTSTPLTSYVTTASSVAVSSR